MKLLILAAVAGCCFAAPNRGAKVFEVNRDEIGSTPVRVHQTDVERVQSVVDGASAGGLHQADAPIPPVVPKGRSREVYGEGVPSYPEFGIKVGQNVRKVVVRPRGRSVLGRVPEEHGLSRVVGSPVPVVQQPVPEAAYPVAHYDVPSPRHLAPTYKNHFEGFQAAPSYQSSYKYEQPAYNSRPNNYYQQQQQQRTDDVPQSAVVGPLPPNSPQSDGNLELTTRPVAILSMNQDVNYDGRFVYDFESENGIKSAVSGSTKRLEGVENPVQVMSGIYSYTSPEGQAVETKWYADETGFHAEGDHLPVAPPVPEAIQRAVDYIKSLPPKDQEVVEEPLILPSSPQVEASQQRYEKPAYQRQNYDYNQVASTQHRHESYPSQY